MRNGIMFPSMKPLEYIRRKVFGVSQVEMAAIAGVNQGTVSRWEAGTLKPDLEVLERIRASAHERGIKWRDSWFFEVAA
jgi:predicted transcriptional regulator